MAAVSEQTRVNFNPEWMGATYSASSKLGGGLATSPPAYGGGGIGVVGGNTNVYSGGGSAANNADGQVLAPPKLAKNRYGREEMLALFTGTAKSAPDDLKPTFPEFFIEPPQDPICCMQYSDVEERLLIQGGINSSKVINVVNHAERQMRWSQQPPRSFGRGMGLGNETPPGGLSQDNVAGLQQQSTPPFVSPRPQGYAGVGVGRGVPRGPYVAPGGFDQMRPPGRFSMLGKGRGDGGRGRGFDRFPSGPGGFGGPAPFAQAGVRFSDTAGQGGQTPTEEDWATPAPQNTRAQGLYDPNDPRDRPRQRQKSTSRIDDADDPAAAYGVPPGMVRGSNMAAQRRSFTAPIGQAVPEWAMDDEDVLDDNFVGTFDSSGQFQEASDMAPPGGLDMESDPTKKKSDVDSKSDAKSIDSVTMTPSSATDISSKSSGRSPISLVLATKQQSVDESEKGSKFVGRSIPVQTLFENTPQQQPFRDPINIGGIQNQNQNQNRRLPKAFAGLGGPQQQDQGKLNVMSSANSAGASPDSSMANMDIGKILGQQQQLQQQHRQQQQAPPYSMQQQQQRSDKQHQQQHQQQQQNVQVQPKFVVPKTISSSSDEVFIQLHEDVESLVNSFSADDMPSVVRNKKGTNFVDATRQQQQQQQPPSHQGFGGTRSGNAQQSQGGRNVNQTTPQTERGGDSANVKGNAAVGGQRWYYTDPQGGLRGPFESTQMAAWFAAGYFTMQLLVRRAEDTDFVPLGDLIKTCGRIPFVTSSSSSTADTPSPNPMSTASSIVAAATMSTGDPTASSVVQPAARYGVKASMTSSAQNVPSNILGALTNHTGGGAFQKATSAQHTSTTSAQATSGGGVGLWDMDFTSASIGNESKADPADIQARMIVLQLLQKEHEEKARAEEEKQRQREILEAREVARREQERKEALLREKEEELKRLQEAKVEAERRRKEAEEEAKRLEQKRMLEEQQRRLEELQKKEIEEKRKRAAEEEKLRKQLAAKEAAERKKIEEENKRAALLKQQHQEEQQRLEQKKKQQQQKKASAAPWGSQPTQPQSKNGVVSAAGKDASSASLMEIQMEEERIQAAEKRQEFEQEVVRRQNLPPANVQLGSAWGGGTASAKLKWEQANANKGGVAWGGKGEVQNVGSQGLWDEEDSPPPTPQKTKNTKPNQSGKSGGKNSAEKDSRASSGLSTKKEQNVKRIFQAQQSPSDEFTSWCVKQVTALDTNIDAPTFVAFLKEVEALSEVEDYVLGYFGDTRSARDFAKSFLEKRSSLRKSASSSKSQADDLSTPAPALNPMKLSAGGGENLVPNFEKSSGGAAACGGGGGNKKKKSGKSAGRFVVDGSILGFKATGDPNRLNAGEIDNPM